MYSLVFHNYRINTPALDYSGAICLKFYYHMNGDDIGTLTVYRSSQGDNNPLVEIRGAQGNSWQSRSIETNINVGEEVSYKVR